MPEAGSTANAVLVLGMLAVVAAAWLLNRQSVPSFVRTVLYGSREEKRRALLKLRRSGLLLLTVMTGVAVAICVADGPTRASVATALVFAAMDGLTFAYTRSRLRKLA